MKSFVGRDPNTCKVLFNSLFIATVKTMLAVSVGVFLAWVVVHGSTSQEGSDR